MQSNKISSIIKYSLMACIGLALLYMAFKGNDPAKIYDDLKKANYFWVILASCFALLANISRAMRWNILLEPMGYKPSVSNTTYAVAIGYFANIAFPRLGEVSRCTVLNQAANVPFETAIGTVISERIIDFLTLCVLTIIVFFTQQALMMRFFESYITPYIHTPSQLGIIILICLFILMICLSYYLYKNKNVVATIETKLKSSELTNKIFLFSKGVLNGLKSVLELKQKGAFIFHTVFIWTMYFLMTYVCVFAIPATSNLQPSDGLFLLIAGSLGMMMPVQGGIGPFEFFISNSMVLFGIAKQDGFVYATIVHGSQIIFTIILGSFSFLMLFLSKKKDIA